MRVRVRFAKAGKLRFISAIDLGRVWERALRKADLPIAYSEGFSPHPKVSFGDALPLGFASTAEFCELTFAGPVDLADMAARLDAAFPDGIAVVDAVEAVEGDMRLGKLLQASLWELTYPSPEGLVEAVDALPADGPLPVQRMKKDELVTADLRPALVGIVADGARVRATVRHPGFIPGDHVAGGSGGAAVRADDIHTLLGLDAPPTVITRLVQGRVDDSTAGVADALRGTVEPLRPGTSPPSPATTAADPVRTDPRAARDDASDGAAAGHHS